MISTGRLVDNEIGAGPVQNTCTSYHRKRKLNQKNLDWMEKRQEFLKLLRRVKVAILNARFGDCNIFECRTSDLEHLTIMHTALLLGLAIFGKTNKQLLLFEQQLLSFQFIGIVTWHISTLNNLFHPYLEQKNNGNLRNINNI